MRKFTSTLCILALSYFSVHAQSIQWSHLLLPGDVNLIAKDSSEKTLAVFKSRLFVYDSLQRVSKETGVGFFDHTYFAEFKKPQEINHVIIGLAGGSRLMYSIRLFDEQDEPHIVYNYGAIHPCRAETSTLLLTIAHTPYKVKRIEIGTFTRDGDKLRVGISGEQDGNKVMQELVSQRLTSLCIKASYFTDKIALNNGINSESFEVKPVISPDGKTLYFHRQNHKDNIGGKKDDQDIYVSRLIGNEWSTAENMQSPLNDNLPNGIASVSSGETSLFLINEYEGPNRQKQGLSHSEKTIEGWTFPKKIEVKNFYNRSEYIDYFISPTQNEMILAIQRDDSFGDQDLYVSFFDDATQSWTEPQHLGPELNTMLSETSPFLAADGKTLYFASNGFLGYGGFDIFVTRRLDDSWTNWSFPENLGPVINSFDDDLYYTISAAGDNAYFVSTVEGDRNIFKIPLPTIYKPEPVVLVTGKILNQKTLAPEAADIQVRWHQDTEVIGSGKSDPVTGEFKFVLPAGGIYDYTISKEGYATIAGLVNTEKTRNYEEVVRNIAIRPTDFPVLGGASFQVDTLLKSQSQWIQKLSTFVNAFDDFYLKASSSRIEDNSELHMIKTALVKQGVSPNKIRFTASEDSVLSLALERDSAAYAKSNADAPTSYVKPRHEENTDVPLLVKGKVINATTFRPVSARLVFKVNDKVKSRSSSDPSTGIFQSLVNANTKFDVSIFGDSLQETASYKSPNVSQYTEVNTVYLINKKTPSVSFELGAGTSENMSIDEQLKFAKTLKKKKSVKEFVKLADSASVVAPRFLNDLIHLAEVIKYLPEAKVLVTIHTSSKNEAAAFQNNVGRRILDVLTSHGVKTDVVSIKAAGTTEPRHPKAKHHSNNRVVIDVKY